MRSMIVPLARHRKIREPESLWEAVERQIGWPTLVLLAFASFSSSPMRTLPYLTVQNFCVCILIVNGCSTLHPCESWVPLLSFSQFKPNLSYLPAIHLSMAEGMQDD